MCRQCIPMVCRECGEEYCLRCEKGVCPKCGTPWNAKERKLTVYDWIVKPAKDMELKEITEEVMKLRPNERTKLVNLILTNMGNNKVHDIDDDTRAMPVYEALSVFGEIYKTLKRTTYAVNGKYCMADFKNMKVLLVKIDERLKERGTDVSDSLLIDNLRAFLMAVSEMKNQWYFENRFTPTSLAADFDKLFVQLSNANSHARQQQAYDYL